MIIRNGIVYDSEKGFIEKELVIEGERISENTNDQTVLDAKGMYVIPGLVDVHFHGCMGADFCDASQEALETIASYELHNGVMSILPASMTLSEEELLVVMKNAAAFEQKQKGLWKEDQTRAAGYADLMGIHMEGPYFSKAKKGAQREDCIIPASREHFEKLQKAASQLIRIVSLAPEEPGAMQFIQEMKDQVVISVGHTMADYDTAREAFSLGARHVTHTFNAMLPFSHRAPGVVGAAFDSEGVMPELICDGIHVAAPMIRAAFQLFGNRLVLISDSMMGTGLADGMYQLGGQPVKKTGRLATLTDGTIAGSVTNLYDCMRHVMTCGISKEEAVRAASENPAKSVGMDDQVGTLRVGSYANVILADESFEIKRMIHRGMEIA